MAVKVEEQVVLNTEVLSDLNVRKAVYEAVNEELDDLSMREIHYVLDALISVLEG